jgi:hypothetical protein
MVDVFRYEDFAPFDSYEWKARRKPVEAHQSKARKAEKGAEEMAKKLEAREARMAVERARKEQKEKEEEERDVFIGLKVALHGKAFSVPLAQLKGLISERGGEVLKAAKGADMVLSTEAVVQEGKGKLLKDALTASIPIIKEEWVHDSLAKADMQPMQAYSLSQASFDVLTRLIDEKKSQKKASLVSRASGAGSGKSVGLGGKSGAKSGKIKLKKGARAAVDADSGLDETGHILEESDTEIYRSDRHTSFLPCALYSGGGG